MSAHRRRATVVVIGAGQAGLSAAFHLLRRGFTSALTEPRGARTFVVLDANFAPGGAWQHRWMSLTMATVNGIFDLPGMRKPPVEDEVPSRVAVPRYFAAYERAFDLPVLRPVRASAVRRVDGELDVDTDAGTWRAQAVINASGTWDNPVRPHYRGQERFIGRQVHSRDYVSGDEFAGQRVAVVGGGISALQHIEELSRVATTFWYTRREPVWLEEGFEPETTGREVTDRVMADVEAGRPTGSISSYTGLPVTPFVLAARARGALVRRPMFAEIGPRGVREADGTVTTLDAMVWATGFTAALDQLEPLRLRNEWGGITMRGTRVRDEPRLHLIGYGPSQSTVGANRAGREAVAEIATLVDGGPAGTGPGERALEDSGRDVLVSATGVPE